MTLYKNFVQAGRLAVGLTDRVFQKAVVVVDIVNLRRVIIEGKDVPRMMIPLKWLKMTDILVPIARGASSEEVQKALESEQAIEKLNQTPIGQKIHKFYAKRSLSDFERFKAQRAKAYVAKQVRQL